MDTINTPQNIVADLRIDYADGQTVTITVPADATFKEFYFSGDHATDRNFGAGLGQTTSASGLKHITGNVGNHARECCQKWAAGCGEYTIADFLAFILLRS